MAKAQGVRKKSGGRIGRRPELVHQFLVVLSGTDPLVWRRIQVPEDYSFWDLHVAIQDAMGWLDYHLHEFRLLDAAEKRVVSIGIPTDEDPEDRPVIPGWKVPLSKFFESRPWHSPPALYAYDFGDDWEHVLVHEGIESAEPSLKYPRCVAGARRCPPEDCGGITGFAEFLQAISNADHPEHDSMLQWAGGTYHPDAFDPAAVVFDDPHERWRKAFRSAGRSAPNTR
jgi:Plasmid pRiA4b ORF-3-like protein